MMHKAKPTDGGCKQDQAEVAAKFDCGLSLLATWPAGASVQQGSVCRLARTACAALAASDKRSARIEYESHVKRVSVKNLVTAGVVLQAWLGASGHGAL